MAIDANGDGEISPQEALNAYQLKVGINNIYHETCRSQDLPTEIGSFDLTNFTNVRVLRYNGSISTYDKNSCFERSFHVSSFTNLEELYYLDGHNFYKAYPFNITLPKYLPNLKIMDAPEIITYSKAPNLEDLFRNY